MLHDDKVSPRNDSISVRFSDDRRAVLRRFSELLKISEGQILKMCFEDITAMVGQVGEERLPHLVHLLRAAEDYEITKPKLASYSHSGSKRSNSSLNEKKGVKP